MSKRYADYSDAEKERSRQSCRRYKLAHPRMPKPRATPVERFWNKVQKTPDCWLWQAGRDRNGYGVFSHKGKYAKAHRFSVEIHQGCIPAGMQVLHKCDNPPCVNPAHLFIGTAQDNVNDRKSKGRTTAGRWL